jgi:pyrroline-5-carboxylate reductase
MALTRLALQGTGHLAAALIKGFNRVADVPISLYNRTLEHALALAMTYPSVRVVEHEEMFDSERCPLLFVVPGRTLLSLSKDRLERLRHSGRVIVSCANGLPLSLLEKTFPGIPWVKSIPSVAAGVGKSVTLVAKGASVPEGSFREVREIFESVGRVILVQTDEEMDRLSVLTSCLPGILATILRELARTYGLTEIQTRELLVESSLGCMLLANEDASSLPTLEASVSNPGGLTEVGASFLRENLPQLFADMKIAMDNRIQQRRQSYLGIS